MRSTLRDGHPGLTEDYESGNIGGTVFIGTESLIRAYVQQGAAPQLIQECAENDLMAALNSADSLNDEGKSLSGAGTEFVGVHTLRAMMVYFANECPAECWGSPERVAAWIESGGLQGSVAEPEKGGKDAEA